MNIKETFINLTSKTYPYGFEDTLVMYLPNDYQRDMYGNYYVIVGNSDTVFTSHLDTACKDQVKVNHVFDGDIIKTDGTSILGADDKAGVTIMLYMIHNKIPGLYYFFTGEEVGCIGSKKASTDLEFFDSYKKMISFDRRGTESVITHQSSTRTCSDEFAKSLSNELNKFNLNFSPDETGVYTDSAEFKYVIPECTNISVGYYGEHTKNEKQDIAFLQNLCEAVINIDWNSLVVSRDPSVKEYLSYSYDSYNYYRNLLSNSSKEHRSRYIEDFDDSWDGSSYYDLDYYKTNNNTKKKKRKRRKTKSYNRRNTPIFPNEIDNDEYEILGKQYFEDLSHPLDQIGANKFKSSKNESYKTNHYDGLKDFYLDDRFNQNELDILKDQYFDMSNQSEREYFKTLIPNK